MYHQLISKNIQADLNETEREEVVLELSAKYSNLIWFQFKLITLILF